ncbi:amidohydrolase [Sinanaerobacter sp. ZZT-01]|uniref:M20 metallopeptidase family protein n=1 Tax=Sinanaerobacter sp. ZZT-01 TaxID=3111540 RepID=UPI002D76B9F8|nr:amidohydrolase [Sinanaerobacter sp. ZZT-01]WRR94700.1 amidohydrolase [Sinanaerobacter sp. ZZT-01]
MILKEVFKALDIQIQFMKEEIISNRRYFHMHPEIGFDTLNTEKRVREFLEKEEIEVISSKIGVVARIKGKDHSRMIALRADMDALSLQEENEVPYKSVCPNKMHACGHDGHTAMLLAAAKILQSIRSNLSVDVLLIFQPAEEGPNLGGARIIMNDLEEQGLADKILYIFGLHLFNDFETGKVGIRYGSLMSSTDEFDIKIIGKGGHAGQPHTTVDALSIGAKFVSAVESFMSRGKNPLDPAVCSIGIFHSGSAKNIVAETAVISGTIRCQTESTRESILENLEKILKGICEGFGADYQMEVLRGLPVLINDENATGYAENLVQQAVGDKNIFHIMEPTMGAEDFAFYAQKIPASFLWIGSGNKEKGFINLAHQPRFDFDEAALFTGVKVLCCLAMGV